MPDAHDEATAVRDGVLQWLDAIIIGHDLCPFAQKPRARGQIHVAVSDSEGFEASVEDALTQVEELIAAPRTARATTLIAYPHALADFDDFLDAAAVVEAILDDIGLVGTLQVATFHPKYVFEGEAEGSPTIYTNRAPYPILHLLREADVTEAVARHPAPEAIPVRNQAHMRALAEAGQLKALFAPHLPSLP